MAEIESNININADTTGAVEAIKNLQRQISAFQISMARGNASAQSAAKKMQQNLIDNIDATGKFNASLTNIKSTTESFTDALERNKLTMGEYFRFAGGASKTFGRSFKREFDVIQKVAIERVKDLQTQYVSLGRDANGALKAIKIRPLTLDMKDFGVQTQIAAQRAQLFNQLIDQGSTNLLNWGKNTQWAGRQLMVGFTVPLTMMGTVASKTFMQIEEQVIKLRRVYGDFATSVEDTDKMVKSIRSLANEFTKWGVSVEKTMQLAADAAATGKMGADLIDQVTEATRLAVLGQVEQQDALETTMSITNAFGTATEQLARKIDFLNAVENQSVTAIEDLTIAIPKAGPVIKQLGGDVEDLAFFLTAMKEGGINASEGANALKSGLASLINPTNKASEFMAKFGINITKIVEANKGDVKGLVIDFAQALDTLDPLNRARSIEQLFGKFQFSRLSTLFQNVIKQGSQAERVLGLAGASAEELAIVSERELAKLEQSTTYRFQKATADFQAALAPIGEEFLKAITPIIKLGTDVLKAFNNMSGGAKQFVTNLTLIVGGVGPALLMTVGLIANGVANLIKFFNMLRNIFAGTSESGTDVASSTQYMTQAQIEAAAVASSLDQEHNKLVQTFGVEAEALSKLTSVYERAIRAQAAYTGQTPPSVGNPDVSTGYAKGVLSVPGPKGAGDIVPAMLSPGEAVIPAKQTQKYKPLIRGIIAGNLRGYATGGIIEDKQEDRYVIGAGKYASQQQIEEAVYKAAQYVYASSPRFAPEGSRSGLTFFGGLAHSLAMERANVYRRQEIADIESIVASGGVKSKFTTGQAGRGGFEHLDRSRLTVSEMIYGQASEGVPGSEIYGYLKSPILPYDISQILPIIQRVATSMGKDPSILENEIMGQLAQDNEGILKNPRVSGYGELDLKFNREAMMASNAQAIIGDSLSSSTDDLLEYNARMKAIKAMPIAKLLSGNYTEEEQVAMFGPSNSPAFYEVAIPGSAATLANVDSAQLLDSVSTVRTGKGFDLSQVSAERVNQVKQMLGKVGIDLDTGMYNEEAMQALLSQYGVFEPSAIGMGIKGYNDKRTFESEGLTPASLTDINGKPITIGDVISQYERVTKGGTGWDKDSKFWRRIPGFEDGGIVDNPQVSKLGKTIKTRDVYEAAAEAAYQAYLSSSLAGQEPENYLRQHSVGGGHSFQPFGVGGVYTKPDGTQVYVKPVPDELSALAEIRGTQIAREGHGLITPQQRMVVIPDPTDYTGQRRFLALESPLDTRLINDGTQGFTQDQYFKQLVASLVRGDKDLSADNLFGDVLADVGPAGVFTRASGVRTYAEAMPSMAEQAMINLLGVKGGAKRAFAESTSDIARSLTPEQYNEAMRAEILRVIPSVRSTIKSMSLTGEDAAPYEAMLRRLEEGLGVDWGQFQGIHAQVPVPVQKFAKGGIAGKIPAEAYDFDDTLIDLTTFLVGHRERNAQLPPDQRKSWGWGAIKGAAPMPKTINRLLEAQASGKQIIILTARPNRMDEMTMAHLEALGIDPNSVKLVSRDVDDPTISGLSTPELKSKLAQELTTEYDIQAFFDDLAENRDALTALGIPSFDPLELNGGGILGQGKIDTNLFNTDYGQTPGGFQEIEGVMHYLKKPRNKAEGTAEIVAAELYRRLGGTGVAMKSFPGGVIGSEELPGVIDTYETTLESWIKSQADPIAASETLLQALSHYAQNDAPINSLLGNIDTHPGNIMFDTASGKLVNMDIGNSILTGFDTWDSEFSELATDEAVAVKERILAAIKGAGGRDNRETLTALAEKYGFGNLAGLGLDEPSNKANAKGKISLLQKLMGFSSNATGDELLNADPRNNKFIQQLIAENPGLEKRLSFGKLATTSGDSMVESLAQLYFRARDAKTNPIFRYANGVVSVPGPKGAGDIIPAMLSPGEAVIPAKQTAKYKPLIQGMIAGNLPGFMAGTDGASSSSRRRKNTSQEIITDLLSSEDSNFTSARQTTEELISRIESLGIPESTSRSILADYRLAIKQGGEVLIDYVSRLTGAIDTYEELGIKSSKTLLDITRKGFDPRTGAYDPAIAAKAIAINPAIDQTKAQFSHLDEGITKSRDEMIAAVGDAFETFSESDRRELQAASNISMKSGLGVDLSGVINRQLANKGVDIATLISELDSRGAAKWATSVEIGNGNLEELTDGLAQYDSIIKELMQSISDQTGITTFVDSMKQVERLGGNAIPMDAIYEAALERLRNIDAATFEVLNNARNTITELRADGGVGTGVMNRGAGGIAQLDTTEFITARLESDAYTLGQTLATRGQEAFIQGLRDRLEIASPSRVMENTAAGVADGVVNGVESATPAATAAGQNLANEIVRPALTPELVDQAYAENAQFDAMRAQQDAAQRKQRSMMNAYRVGRGISYGLTGLSMVASFIPQIGEVAQKVTPSLTAFSTGMSVLPGPLGYALGSALALGTVFMQVQGELDKTRKEATRLAESLGTGSKALQKYAEAAGKATASDIMQRRRENQRVGISVKPGKLKFGAGFVAGESGQAMIADMQKATEEYGKSAAIQKLGTQLATAIISGVLTADQAKQIAYSIGRELKDTRVTIGTIAQINDIVGPNGKKFEDNPVEVSGKLVGNISSELDKVNSQIEALTGDLFRGFDLAKLEGQAASLTIDLVSTQQQVVDALELEYSRRIDNLNAQNRFNEALRLTNELENKKREVIKIGSKELQSILGSPTARADAENALRMQTSGGKGGGVFITTDGATFTNREEAIQHQAEIMGQGDAAPNSQVISEITARIKAEYAGTEDETMINTLMDSTLKENTQFNALMKVGIASGTIDPTAVNIFDAMFTENAFGAGNNQVVKDMLVRVGTSMGVAGVDQLMKIVDSIPEGANAAELRLKVVTIAEGNMSDPIYGQQVLDTLSMFTTYADAYPAGVDVTAILEFYTNPANEAKFQAAMSDIANFKKLERKGKLNIRSISEFLTDEEGMLAVKENEKFFSKLDPSQKFLYVQTIRTIYETIGTQEINEYRAANAEATAGLTDLEVKARIANEAAESLVENSSAINDLGDSAKDAANEVGGLANEFDALTAKIDMYQKALSVISLKEEKINKKYDERAKALEEVAKINEEIAQQQQNQLDIADALSRGDIAAAARAVQKYRADQATLEIQKQQDALEKARENEIAQVAFAGFTREELEKKLQRLEMRLARRDYRESVDYFRNQGTPTNTGTTDDTTDPDKPKPPKPPKDTNGNDDKFLTTAELNAKVEEKRAKRIAELNKQVATGEITTTEYSAALRKLENDLVIYRNSLEDEGRRRRLLTREINKSGKAYEESGLLAASGYSAALDAADQYARKAKAASDLASGKITLKAYENIVEGMASGGMVKGYASGGVIPKYFAFGGNALGSDTVAAMLSPGEFVVKRSAVQSYGVDNLKAINNGTAAPSSGVYNYSINVNVSTDASPEQIARAVAQNVKRTESYRIRGNRL